LFLTSEIGFLWFNVIGSGIVVVLSLGLQTLLPRAKPDSGG
jgi:hypothetical protein